MSPSASAYWIARLYVLVRPPRVVHIAQHDLAYLERRLAEADLQDLDVSSLHHA
jgi:hypothetical protein